jgi:very-short-patch-repair endonuclease
MTERKKRLTQVPPPASGGGQGVGSPGKSGIVMGYHGAEKQERARELRRVMTRAEAMLWPRLRANRLGGWQFRRQQVIDGFIVDFYCHHAGLVVEIDGAVHATQTAYDAERDIILAARGLRILRLTNDQVLGDLDGCLDLILAAGSPPPGPLPTREGEPA